MERAGIEPKEWNFSCIGSGDDIEIVSKVIGLNAHRRHLTKQMKADMIVAAHRAAAKLNRIIAEPVSPVSPERPRPTPTTRPTAAPKGGRGKKNPVKQAAVETAKEHGISESTIKRSIAKAEGRFPEPSRIAGPRLSSRPKLEKRVGIHAARSFYLDRCGEPDVDLDHERELILEAFRELAGKRAMARPSPSALDYPDLPEFLDRRQR
jgi:hypothetical protein